MYVELIKISTPVPLLVLVVLLAMLGMLGVVLSVLPVTVVLSVLPVTVVLSVLPVTVVLSALPVVRVLSVLPELLVPVLLSLVGALLALAAFSKFWLMRSSWAGPSPRTKEPIRLDFLYKLINCFKKGRSYQLCII
jgi:hypothetical protein